MENYYKEKKERERNKIIEQNKNKKQLIILVVLIISIILIDQITKIIMQNIDDITIIPNLLQFKIDENVSGDSGLDSDSNVMNIITNLIVIGVIFKFIKTQNSYIDTKIKVFLSFIFAGGLSNVIDRVCRGYVMEFIDFTPAINIPIFNIADIFVVIGWMSFVWIFAVFTVKESRARKQKETKRE